MIDSHCHLDHEPMFSDLKNVIIRSKENGLEKILSICTTNDSFKKNLIQKNVRPSMKELKKDLQSLSEFINDSTKRLKNNDTEGK